jgi:hypothetical protein
LDEGCPRTLLFTVKIMSIDAHFFPSVVLKDGVLLDGSVVASFFSFEEWENGRGKSVGGQGCVGF